MKKKFTFLLLGLLVTFTTTQAQTWTQIGQDIYGIEEGSWSGWSVSLSSDGSTVAIGAKGSYINYTHVDSYVRVYQQNRSGNWNLIGQIDSYGSSVSLSSNGTTVAVGASDNNENGTNAGQVRIYQYQDETWTQIGQDINGEAAGDNFGWAVSLSSDGSTVAIGAPHSYGKDSLASTGQVRIYQNQSGTWEQIGQDINGKATGDNFGFSVSLSSDGSTVAIGAPNSYGNDSITRTGQVRIYQNQSGTWAQIGQDINGEASCDNTGWSVSLNSDGTTVAIGAPGNVTLHTCAGRVRVYQNQSGTWAQIGQDINGEAANDNSGQSISLNSDGTTVAIGAPNNNGNLINTGQVRIYQNQSGTWAQIGQDIDGKTSMENIGFSVSLKSDGLKVAFGAPTVEKPYGVDNAGVVRVYEIPQPPVITTQPANQTNICPGDNVSFTIAADNIDIYPPWEVNNAYQWQVNEGSGFGDITNGGVYDNATTDTLNITGVTLAMNNFQYRCVLTNPIGSTTSDTAVLITDYEAPVLDVATLTDVTAECEVTTLTAPTATDNCAGTITGTHNVTLPITTQGTTVVTWSYDDGNGNTVTQDQNVIIEDVTNPTITCVGNQTIDLLAGDTVYTVTGTEFDPTVTDDNCNVSSVINDFNSTATLAGVQLPIGTTTIAWVVTDDAANTDTCTFDVTVDAYTGIETLQQKGTTIYPNPTNGIVNFNFAVNNIQKIIVSDETGKQIIEKTEIKQSDQIDLSGFDSGIYFISIQTDKEIFTTKIINR